MLDKKLTSKGDRGIVTVETKGINQRGEEVCYFRRKVMVWTARGRADSAAARTRDAIWADDASDRPAERPPGFGARRRRLRAGPARYPRRGRRAARRRARHRPGARGRATSPPAPASSPACSSAAAPTWSPSSRSRRCGRSSPRCCPDVEVLDGTAEAIPARRRRRRRRHRRPGVPLVRLRRRARRDRPGRCVPAGGLGLVWNRARRVGAVGRPMSEVVRVGRPPGVPVLPRPTGRRCSTAAASSTAATARSAGTSR